MREVLDSTPILPPFAEFEAADRALQDRNRHIFAVWESLGVRGHLTEDNRLHITVS
ncbi:hypothetical protein [Streptomyces sp. NBC_00057]|uniref:hypothetical protein n=1 Tax=Streptomyces sp. NBC_00057 TaxID=2975634 RepID=UPI00325223D7